MDILFLIVRIEPVVLHIDSTFYMGEGKILPKIMPIYPYIYYLWFLYSVLW